MYGVATNSPTPAAGPFVSPKKTSPISSGRSRRSPGRTSRTPPKSGAEDFPLSHFQERIDDIVDRLEHGLGLVLLRGLPIYDRFSEDEAAISYWGMGRHMGNLVPQNRKGDPGRPYKRPREARPPRASVRNKRRPGVPHRLHRLRGPDVPSPRALWRGEFRCQFGAAVQLRRRRAPRVPADPPQELPDRLAERGTARVTRLVPGAALQLLRGSALGDRQDRPGNVSDALPRGAQTHRGRGLLLQVFRLAAEEARRRSWHATPDGGPAVRQQLRDRAHPHGIRRRRREPSASTAPATTVDQPARSRPAALPRVRGLAQRLPDITDATQRGCARGQP